MTMDFLKHNFYFEAECVHMKRLKFKTSKNLPIILEEYKEYTLNWRREPWKKNTFQLTLYKLKWHILLGMWHWGDILEANVGVNWHSFLFLKMSRDTLDLRLNVKGNLSNKHPAWDIALIYIDYPITACDNNFLNTCYFAESRHLRGLIF